MRSLQRGPRKSGDDGVLWTPAAFAWQAQHLEHLSVILHGSAALGAPESHFAWQVQHWKHLSCVLRWQGNTINTTSSTQHHLHDTINTTPSTQHHLHNTIYTTSSHTGRCSTWSTAILPLLLTSASFLLIPLLLFFVVVSPLFCFVDLFHTWMSEEHVGLSGPIIL